MKEMHKRFATFALILAASSTPSFAYAAPAWASVGAGCVPTGQTTKSDARFNTAGRTVFDAGKTGEIILTCPITAPIGPAGEGTVLQIAYRDPDGVNNGARIVAALRRMNKVTGAVATFAQFDSNSSVQTTYGGGGALVPGSCGFVSPFDHNNFYYYVQINMTRTSTSLPVELGAVALEPTIC